MPPIDQRKTPVDLALNVALAPAGAQGLAAIPKPHEAEVKQRVRKDAFDKQGPPAIPVPLRGIGPIIVMGSTYTAHYVVGTVNIGGTQKAVITIDWMTSP
jgi:hypothetical protein